MSSKGKQLRESELEEWMTSLGVQLQYKGEERSFRDCLRDGVALCTLINIIRPNSVEEVSVCCV